MKIDSISTASADPIRLVSAGLGFKAIARTSANSNIQDIVHQKSFQKEKPSAEELKKDLESINNQFKSMNSSLQFIIDEKTNDVVVKIVDNDTGKVIRQIPSDDVLRIREHIKEMSGLIVEKKI